ncbi:NrsF family protein [Burkholderia oklahomensis]|uniref:NrsF family protein n=1 Tax=Burkholderia oklahomensis TaxID=342113 RepID=UPI00016A8724|nr:DUF1109 domain-containing protein [Burkholderia oklahomensis]AJX34884.1 hypothetical protein BG90_5433 [Burkholderia oklahomensis C6786]AOI49078.1 hypothetical protein WI23_25110 [Burkholderia oklahomensis C6786]KUY60872.1 hypothetical protein WI23_14385 [Burkholderia oklahomensis C6786]MBI0362690.1 DUF1109 domain-containing protein [Burkholderia oklahomensis]MDN7671160.1 DUF1109 domain-containing protein [Burkholderia oklahomensis]
MRSTDALIESLVTDAAPVRRLHAPAWRATGWLLFAAVLLACVAVAHRTRPDLPLKLHEPMFATRVAAAALTGVLSAVSAFVVGIPGRSLRWLLLPTPALLAWISTIGYGCLTDWVEIGPNGISAGETLRCFATLTLVGVPLSLALLLMSRHAARLAPMPVAAAGGLAVSALSAVALSLFHPIDATAMILVWNIGVAVLASVAGARYGQRLFAWVAP